MIATPPDLFRDVFQNDEVDNGRYVLRNVLDQLSEDTIATIRINGGNWLVRPG